MDFGLYAPPNHTAPYRTATGLWRLAPPTDPRNRAAAIPASQPTNYILHFRTPGTRLFEPGTRIRLYSIFLNSCLLN